MDEQKGSEDTDQQKKVTFDEKDEKDVKDDRAPTSKENKGQDQEHDDLEEEGRRSRTSRTSRASSADAYLMESDEEKLKRAQNEDKITNKDNEEKNNTETSNNDMKDGLDDDLEILQNSYKQEENKQKTRNEAEEVSENKEKIDQSNIEENNVKDDRNKPENMGDNEKTEARHNKKDVEFDRVSNNSGYSLNSRRPKNEQSSTVKESKNKTSYNEPESSTKYVTDDEKLSEIRSSVSSLDSRGNAIDAEKENTKTEDEEERAETNKTKETYEEEQKSDERKEQADNAKDDTKQLQHMEETKDENKNWRDDPQYQKDEDDDDAQSQSSKSKKEKETKVTINVLQAKSPNNEQTQKPPQKAEPKKSTATTYPKKQAVSSSKPAVSSPSHQSYPRSNQKESLSPREIVADQRKERRQKSQSARYPSQGKSSSRDVTMATRSSSRTSTLRSSRPPSRARTSLGFSTERRRKEKEFFHAELQRLKDSLRKESKKIKKPKVRDHYPFVFTDLAPYYNTYTANYLINMPDLGYKETQPAEAKKPVETEDTKELMYTTRCTSIGLVDPCDSLSMDRNVLPKLETAEIRRKRIEQMHAASKPKSGRDSSNTDRSGKTSPRQKRPEAKQGSTRLPKFPVIAPPNAELTTKELHYGDVPMLRDEMTKSFSHYGDDRKKSDYERTKQDFYRMELDRLDEYHQTTRPHMRAAYFAYLQNTPGSRKAIYDCMKEVTSPKKKEEQSPQAVA
ncbi:myb-like protein X isoform X2 [Mercenaria mercenaria]|uniref:myb-like protein X isoform X2 n=1 Tax=Mercenaria mercenaria TaxID=6596 RepID=UPI00234F6880|nr:myb-like protein X isoform X2 [Mercenaria mercenaria]